MVQGMMKAVWYNAVCLASRCVFTGCFTHTHIAKRVRYQRCAHSANQGRRSSPQRFAITPNSVVSRPADIPSLPSSSQMWFVSSPYASVGIYSFQYACLVGICGTDGHIHEGEFTSTFPVCSMRLYSILYLTPYSNSSFPVTRLWAALSKWGRT